MGSWGPSLQKDGRQMLIFSWRCLFNAIKERQYTHSEVKHNSAGAGACSAFKTGKVYY